MKYIKKVFSFRIDPKLLQLVQIQSEKQKQSVGLYISDKLLAAVREELDAENN